MSLRREVRTLEDFRESGRSIRAFCSHYYVCSHDAQLRLELLAFHVGWTFDFYVGRDHLAGRLRCSVCGWHNPTFSLGHAGKPPEFAGTHSAGFRPLSPDVLVRLAAERTAATMGEVPWVGIRKGGRKFGR
ncbi:MAG: hypothetical protein KJ944_10120 [Alphaproteobacteria bacterium]|nr:hypothetical protein [Alphaproteobacteria bacterium]MBU1560734.1 hypothetical protein [Alphaproteobacteria bacterium]MBU2302943.1 hypothetical protein [Alphaproteobacteria bacterium]MBU2367670.1 hypothetical protein [Alphaproteobacteria bacterium]